MHVSKEAVAQTREYIENISRCPHELIEAYGHIAVGDRSEQHYKANTPEAMDLINRTKPERYAHIAVAMDILLERMQELRPERPPFGLLDPQFKSHNQWQYFRKAFDQTAKLDIKSLEDDPIYQEAAKLTFTVGALDIRRFQKLNEQLEAGSMTASNNIFRLLEDLPTIIKHFDPSCPPKDWYRIARNSVGLPTKLARRSAMSMLEAREALTIRDGNDKRGTYNPDYFKPIYQKDSFRSLQFADLDGLVESTDGKHRAFIMPDVPPRTTQDDHREDDKIIIGCPIVLLPNRLNELWQWGIDIVEKAGLWEDHSA